MSDYSVYHTNPNLSGLKKKSPFYYISPSCGSRIWEGLRWMTVLLSVALPGVPLWLSAYGWAVPENLNHD